MGGQLYRYQRAKKIEKVLRKTNEELELKIAERTQELTRSNKELNLEIAERKIMERKVRIHNALLRLMERIPGCCGSSYKELK